MKITTIELYSAGNVSATLSLNDPSNASPYIVKALIGLDADEITPRYDGSSTGLVKNYNLTLERREIVMRLVLNPNYAGAQSYSSLRDQIYKVIASSRTGVLELRFKDGATTKATISGFVTKLEAPHTSEIPEIQITMECAEPMLENPTVTNVTTAGLTSPFTITDSVSTAPHGLEMGITFTNVVTAEFKIGNSSAFDWKFGVLLGDILNNSTVGFQIGDQLHINSRYNKRAIYIIRGGQTIHVADRIVANSSWPVLFPGANPMYITPTTWTWNYLRYYHAYWGV